MTSSMLSGERRWTSARRGGMTVLGKVAVPKPLNLPSQRLENHGLDPNVDIVPKGTLSWGSRSSSCASNAWGSSTLSPNADGGTRSPSQLSGRPSSGSGTRPSTAGSDRLHEPTPNAWGQNSRPSSASGAFTSNQTVLTALRPRSAETRPGSSQLSRFAEPSSDNSVAWGPTGISEKLGVASSKNDGFSLSSGDFPTLGSERDNSGKSTDSQGDISVNANVKSGTVNTWRRDGSQHVEDGVQPIIEKWHGDPPPYLNANVPPEHFDAWHGPPMNPPPGVWYRGPPVGPPYGAPLAPGGFPIEPFPYYHPQIPPTALANSQPVPPPGTGPRGHHPKSGDIYRPHIPGAYIRPDMPIRPSFYPGPMAYEGYHGPPMRYCNSNERDIPVMGMTAVPSVCNRYLGENAPDPGNNYARANIHGSVGKTLVSERVESGHSDDSRGPYKVLLKQHNEWDKREEEDKWEHVVPANDRYLEKGDQPRNSLQEHEWGLEDRNGKEFYSGRTFGGDGRSPNFEKRGTCSSDSIKVKLHESRGKAKEVYDSSVNKSENATSTFPQVPQVFPAAPRDPRLIQEIEVLNAKSWASDGELDAASIPGREEQKRRLQEVDAMANCSPSESGAGAVCFERTHTSGTLISSSHKGHISTADKTILAAASSPTTISRKSSHFGRGRLDHHGKRFDTRDADGWRKKPLAAKSIEVSDANSEPSFSVHVRDCLTHVEAAEKSANNLQGRDEGESLAPMFDASDCQVQHDKLWEIARQRAKQLQEEEGEWAREQKAKALEKLEQLNQCTQTMDGSTLKLGNAPCSGPIQQEHEESGIPTELAMDASNSKTPSSALVSYPNSQLRDHSSIKVGESSGLSKDSLVETPDNVHPESDVSHGQPLPLKKDAHTADAADCTAVPQVNEGNVSRHKRMGYKQKQNIPLGKSLTESSPLIGPTEAPQDRIDVAVNDVASTVVAGDVGPSGESSLPMNSNMMAESSAHQRRKNNRKNKHKLDNASSIAALPSTMSKETNTTEIPTDGGKSESFESDLDLDPSSFQSRAVAKHAIQASQQCPYPPSEDAGGRVNNQWKSQHSRRMQRNQQTNIVAEKLYNSDAVIWAPVGSRDKSEVLDKVGSTIVPDIATAMAKSENAVQNNKKSKRAEMERYIPKPVAKELAQQGSIQQSVPSSVNQTASDDAVGGAEPFENDESSQPGYSATGNIRSTSESRNGDGKQTKQSKTNGSWRQRGSVESAAEVLQNGSSPTSNPRKNVQKSIKQHQSLRPDISSLKEQTKSSDDWNTSDGWSTHDNSETAVPVTSAVVKDQGVADRGKRHPFRGHRSMGNNHDLDHGNANSAYTGETSCQPPGSEIGQTDKNIASRENRGVGERVSQWKPKSQVHPFHNQLGNRAGGGQNATVEVGNAIKKHYPSHNRVHLPLQHNKESRENTVLPPIEQSLYELKSVAEAPNVGHQDSESETKVELVRGRPHSPNISFVNTIEVAPPAIVDTQHELRFSSGFHKNDNQNNHSGRGHESRGVWSSAGQDNRQHNTSSSNRGRQRYNSRYEYQPIGQYNNNKSNSFEGPTDGSRNMGSRYRERSQSYSRRVDDNFRGDASYD